MPGRDQPRQLSGGAEGERGREQPGASVRRDRKDEYLQLRIRGLHGKPGRGGSLRDVDEQ